MGFQSRVNSDRFSYLRSSLLYICLELIDIPCRVSFTLSLIQYFNYCRSIDTFVLGSASGIKMRGRLIRVLDQSDQADMDLQVVTVDQFVAAMASIQETITSLGQMMDGQQAQQVPVQESVQYDTTILPPFPPSQIAPQNTQIPPPPPLSQTVL